MTSKGSDIQWLYLLLIRPGDQILRIASHWKKLLHLHIEWPGRNLERFINLESFGLSCLRPVHYLCKYTEFHHMRTECQIIIIHLLLIISDKFLEIYKRCTLPYLIPDRPQVPPNLSQVVTLPTQKYCSSWILSAHHMYLELARLVGLRITDTNRNRYTMTSHFGKISVSYGTLKTRL